MVGLWKMIFKPNDGSRAAVKAEVQASVVARESATNRFEETVKEILAINDRLTGRQQRNETPRI